MKQITTLFFCIAIFSACKKDKQSSQNKPSICFETNIINTNVQDGFMSVFFLNEKNGFVTSDKGGIYKTIESAKTWTALNSTTNVPIRDIWFPSANIGIAVGGENSCGGTGCIPSGGFILRTQDYGQTWNKIFTPSNRLEITSIYFINNLVGYCVGDNVIYKTNDGGQTWSENQISNLGGKMMKIKFSDNRNGFIVCTFDKILKTTNGGNSWQITSPNKNNGYYSTSSSNGATYVSGQGKILKSIDNGVNWQELFNSPSEIYDVHFTTQEIGYAFGRGNYSGGDFGRCYGSIYCTNNGGSSWNGNGDFKDIGTIKAVSFPLSNIGYAVSGNKVIKIVIN